MINGLDNFIEFFRDFADQYVLIGDAALRLAGRSAERGAVTKGR